MTSGIAANLRGEITAFGKGAQAIFGYAPEEVLGKSVALFHPPGAEAMLQELFQTALATGLWEKDVPLVRKNGERFLGHLRVTTIKDPTGTVIGLLGMTTEVPFKGSHPR